MAAAALIQPIAWELPCAAGVAVKRKKRKEKKKKDKETVGHFGEGWLTNTSQLNIEFMWKNRKNCTGVKKSKEVILIII